MPVHSLYRRLLIIEKENLINLLFTSIQFKSSNAWVRRLTKFSSALRNHTRGS